MTIREYAKEVGFNIVGKLTRKVKVKEKFNYSKGTMKTAKIIYWEDEAGNTYVPGCVLTNDDTVI